MISMVGTLWWGLAVEGTRVYTGIVGLSAPEAAECGMSSSTRGPTQPLTAFEYASFCTFENQSTWPVPFEALSGLTGNFYFEFRKALIDS